MRHFTRSDRLSGQILKDVSKFVDQNIAENIKGLITFTDCKLTKDLQYATIFYSFLGKEENKKSVQTFLETQLKSVRKHVGKNLVMRHIPEFSFKYDPSIEEGLKIEKLLNQIHNDDAKN